MLARAFAHSYHAAAMANREAVLARMPPVPGGTLLDVGCDDGRLTVEAGRRTGAARLIGIELAPAQAAAARERGVEAHEVDLGGRWPVADASVDALHSNQVIEHMAATDHFLAEVRRVLGPGGYAVVSTNNLSSWHNVAALLLGWQPLPAHVSDRHLVGSPLSGIDADVPGDPDIHRHLRLFTGRALAELAGRHGLTPDYVGASGFYPLSGRAAALAARAAPRYAVYLVQRYHRG